MNTIVFKWRDEFIRVNPMDIVYFRADGNYSTMTLASRKVQLLTMNLSKVMVTLETQLTVQSELFERVGRDLIIRKECVFSIQILKKQLILTVPGSDIYFELNASKEALKKLKENQIKKYSNINNLQIRELQTRKAYPLIVGNNLFGRQSKSSVCKNQIDNGDNLMSRKHFNLIVYFDTVKSVYELFITDTNSANGIFLNNKQVTANQSQQLYLGDIIRAGKTEFVTEYLDVEKTEII